MGRVALPCLGILSVVAIGAPQLAAASSTQPPPRTALSSFGCHRSSDSLSRWIGVTATMRPLSGTQRMAMKFQLLRKRPHKQAFNDVSAAQTDLGKWIHPTNPPTLGQRPGDLWTVQKQVVNLAAPSAYELRVSFRWSGTGQKVLQTVVRVTAMCHQ
jgi:hypothetical protein